jgi:AraC family transcriptional regulator
MEWSDRMNAAIDYIEENLAGKIDFNEAAKKAYCSTFHFQRIFFAVNGLTPVEYTRRRRLTLAARELLSSNAKVIDLALKYGYESPNAFTRAFRNLHGVTPLAAREPGVQLVAFPRISFHIILKGGNNMDYRIIKKPAFEVIGRARKFTTLNGENFIQVPQFWREFQSLKEYPELGNMSRGKPGRVTEGGCLGVCIPIENKGWDEFLYAIAVEKPENIKPAGFEVFPIPAATWAVFESIGPMPKAIQDVTVRIFQEWFPSTGYEHDAKPELEVYFSGDTNSADYRCQVWMPIVDKKK